MIPKVFHRVWVGDEDFPSEYEHYWNTWRSFHPDWEFVTWRPGDYLPLRNQRQYEEATSHAQRADIARYEILHRYGGVYVDTDFECLKPFDRLIEGIDGFIGKEDETFVNIGLLGAVPRHPYVDQLMAMVPHSVATQPNKPANHQTGPWLATRVLSEGSAIFVSPLLQVFPPSFFYPYRYDELYRRDETFPDAYAVHHWSGSWQLGGAPQRFPDKVRVLLDFAGVDVDIPDSVLTRFTQLFRRGEPAELAVPLHGAPPEQLLIRVVDAIRAVGADPTATADIALYSDDEIARLECAAVVEQGEHRSDREQRAIAVLEAQRRRIDAYHTLVGDMQVA